MEGERWEVVMEFDPYGGQDGREVRRYNIRRV